MLPTEAKLKKISFEKSSKRAALLTFVGVLFVVAALVFSFYQLQSLNKEIADKRSQSAELDGQIDEQKRRLLEMQKHLEETQRTLADFQQSVKNIDPEVAESALNQTIEKNPQAKGVIEQIKPDPPVNPPKNDKKTALEKEREGFEALVAGDYDRAAAAFQAAENAYNGFHNVYELARLLRKNKTQMNDPAKRKEVFQTIVRKHSYGVPPELLRQIAGLADR